MARWDISLSHHIAEMNEADDFIRRRPAFFRSQVKSYFGLTQQELDELLPAQKVSAPKITVDQSLFK